MHNGVGESLLIKNLFASLFLPEGSITQHRCLYRIEVLLNIVIFAGAMCRVA